MSAKAINHLINVSRKTSASPVNGGEALHLRKNSRSHPEPVREAGHISAYKVNGVPSRWIARAKEMLLPLSAWSSFKKMAVIIGSLFILASCTMVVPVDLPDQEPRLVVNSFLKAGDLIQVRVTRSQPLSIGYYDTFHVVRNATVILITDGTQRDTLDFDHSFEGYSRLGKTAQIGRSYRLEVSAAGFTPVHAEATVPQPVTIDSLRFEKFVRTNNDNVRESDLFITFTDHAGRNDYYGMRIIFEPKDMGGEYDLCYSTRDPVLNNGTEIFSQVEPMYYCGTVRFRDNLIDGSRYTAAVSISEYDLDDQVEGTIHVELLSYSEDLYRYVVSTQLQFDTGNNPFAEPVIVFNNITNGFGIFAGQSANKRSIIW